MNDIRMYMMKCNMCKLCVGEYTGVQLIEFRFSSDVWKVHETDHATSEPADEEEYDKDSLYMTLFSSLHQLHKPGPFCKWSRSGSGLWDKDFTLIFDRLQYTSCR